MRSLSLVVALTLLAGGIVLFSGGIGPMLMIARISDARGAPAWAQWAATVAFLATWWGGIGICIVCFRDLLRAIRANGRLPWRLGDGVVLAGHAALLAAGIGMVLGILNVRRDFPVYALLTAAALCYSLGLAALALAARSARR
jgi:hypothetical protein